MNKLTLLFLTLAVGFGTFGFFEQQQAAKLREQVAALEQSMARERAEKEAVTGQMDKMKEQATTQKSVIAQLETRNKELAKNPAPTTDGKPAEGKDAKSGGDFMKGLAKMFSDPKTRDAMRAQHSAQVSLMYAGLAKDLGLQPDVARQVLALLGDRQADIAAKSMAAMSRDEKDLKSMGKETEEVKKTYDDQIKALLGDDGYKKFGEYEKSIGDRVALDQIQRQLAASGTTLEPTQQQGLLDIMREERERTKTPSATTNNQAEAMKLMQDEGALDQWLSSQQDMNRRVLDRARSMLSADQLVAFEAAQKQFLDMQKMGVQMSRQLFQKK